MSNQANVAAQEVARTPNIPTQYTVSPNTAIFLDLLKAYEALYDSIYNAIKEGYDTSQVDKLFDRDFQPILQPIREQIFEYVKGSINQRTGDTI